MKRNTEVSFVSKNMLAELPEPAQRYMAFTGVSGKPWISSVFLRQVGRFRQGIDRPWMPMTAVQTYTVTPPGFLWDARFRIAGLPILRAWDRYKMGEGRMYAKLAGFFTVFDLQGEKLTQGTMVRYLSEMIWFPIAFLGDNITWNAVDSHSADVTLSDAGKSVTGRIFFDDLGRPTNFKAMRYREVDGVFSLDAWSTPITQYGERAGLNLPTHGQAVWNLPSGDLIYADLKIIDLTYNTNT